MATLAAGRHKLLLADDSVAIQKVVQLTFTDEGYEVAVAGNGIDALRLLEEFQPVVVLADISMPGLSGYEVCRRIRRDERFKHLPVLLLVGIFEPFDPKEAREAGADDVLTKPFQSIREMLNKVGAYLTGRPYEEPEYDSRPLRIEAPPVTTSTQTFTQTPTPPVSQVTTPSPVEPASTVFPGAETPGTATQVALISDEPVKEALPEIVSVMDEPDLSAKQIKPQANSADNKSPSSAPPVEPSLAETDTLMAQTADTAELNPTNMETQMSLSSDRHQETPHISPVAPRAQSAADDSLLDLGETTAAASSAIPKISDQDDMILDLGDEPVYAAPAWSGGQQAQPGAATGGQANTSLKADQLSPEVIDAIARRVAEHLSTRAIEDVAWEVVPQLAELLIKQQLEAGKARKM